MKKYSTFNICVNALFLALIIVSAQISIPLPGGIPFTMQTLIIPLAGILLGAKNGSMIISIYVLLGCIGIPVFAGFNGGFQNILGPNGGFIIGFIVLALLCALSEKVAKCFSGKLYFLILSLTIAISLTIQLLIGTVWFAAFSNLTFKTALLSCFIPFIPTTMVKLILIVTLTPQLKNIFAKYYSVKTRY